MNRTAETVRFFKFASELAAACRAGDEDRIAEAVDEIEVIVLHTDNPKLAQRASRLLAA